MADLIILPRADKWKGSGRRRASKKLRESMCFDHLIIVFHRVVYQKIFELVEG